METARKIEETDAAGYTVYYCSSAIHEKKYLGIGGGSFVFCPFCGGYFVARIKEGGAK